MALLAVTFSALKVAAIAVAAANAAVLAATLVCLLLFHHAKGRDGKRPPSDKSSK